MGLRIEWDIGHPGYKRLGARLGYGAAVGVVLFMAAVFGLVSTLHGLVPVAAVAPILVFIGVVMTAQALKASPPAHGVAVTLALIPHMSSVVVTKLGGLAGAASQVTDQVVSLSDLAVIAALELGGVHITGQTALSQGAIVTGLLWGAMGANSVDRHVGRAALFAVLVLVGMIHAPTVGLYWASPVVWGYAVLAAVLGLQAVVMPMEGVTSD